jgi:tyrosine-protein kinase Etk/Wzc
MQPSMKKLDFLRENITLGINTLFDEIEKKRALIQERVKPLEEEINTIPTNERELLQIMRQQQIKESLFLYLLQKREETALSIAAQISNLRILEPVISNGVVAPNRQRYFLLSIFLGLAIPASVILGIYFMDNNVYNRQDVEAITNTPFLGSIGQSPKNQAIVIQKSSRSSIAEMFRLLRTNLQYVQTADNDHQTILVTSSVSGEGKSFITINLGISEALSGKKTILLGFDLRKPKLSEYLVGSREGLGLTHYLVGSAQIEEIIRPIPNYENIDFISCGAIPPNPAELIMLPQTKELFDYLQQRYDRIIIDTPPVGLVTDALLFKDIVDKSIIAVRSGKTKKGLIKMIDDIHRNNKLPKMGIVLNGVKKKSAYGYGYGGYGYGYGYSHGYGYGYYDDDEKKKGRWKVFTRN